jgi:protein-S-isoprenylcysteine O-methyltransferase Ste14
VGQSCRAHCGYGTLAFRPGWNDTVLAGVCVPRKLYGGGGPYLPLSHKKRSCASHAPYERWTDGRKGNNPKDHHAFASMGFIALLVLPALDYRFSWSVVPLSVVTVGDTLVAIGFYFIFLVYKENTFSSATIEVAENQKVISTGPYALVRHPMYASALLYLIGTPLALGSYWGLLALPFMMSFLIWRLVDEEKFLAKNLPGYMEYQKRVQHHLVPYVW